LRILDAIATAPTISTTTTIALIIVVAVIAMMFMHVSVLVDSVGPPSAEVCRTAASFP
jgi:hypothetical protein